MSAPGAAGEGAWAATQAAMALLHEYAAAADVVDEGALRGLFEPDAVVVFAGVRPGGEAIELAGREAVVRGIVASVRGLDAVVHRFTNVCVLEEEAERLLVSSYVDALLVRRGAPGGEWFQAVGAYRDAVRRGPAGFRFARREFRLIHGLGNPRVVRPPRD